MTLGDGHYCAGAGYGTKVEWERFYRVSICPDLTSGLDHLVFHVGGGGSKAGSFDLVFSFVSHKKWRLEYVLARDSVDPAGQCFGLRVAPVACC